jgi:predicted GNAT family N-acyltransferase
MELKIELLKKSHNKSDFDSKTPLLDNYIKKQSSQDVKRNLSACYVLTEDNHVIGYYTLSSSSVPRDEMPEELIQKLPSSYENLPAILLGRLAVDHRKKGKGYGEVLLLDAMQRSLDLAEKLGILSVVVDPIDEAAESFYSKYGFIKIPSNGKMFIAMDTIRKA